MQATDHNNLVQPSATEALSHRRKSPPPPPIPPKARHLQSAGDKSTHSVGFETSKPALDDSFAIYEEHGSDELELTQLSSPGQKNPNNYVAPPVSYSKRISNEYSPQQLDIESFGIKTPEIGHRRSFLAPGTNHHQVSSKVARSGYPSSPQNLENLRAQDRTHGTRSWPIDTFMMEIGALLVVFMVATILVSAIRHAEIALEIIIQFAFCYLYLVSIVWIFWCTIDITRFRRQWRAETKAITDHDEYMDVISQRKDQVFYYPDVHNTGGLFMRAGAGILCMGSALLTILEIVTAFSTISETPTARTSTPSQNNKFLLISTGTSLILRFVFHCIQFMFLFRYGNLIINRYRVIAQIGLIHVVIANFCTWFDAIVLETREQLESAQTETGSVVSNESTLTSRNLLLNNSSSFLRAGTELFSSTSNLTLSEIFHNIETSTNAYLYPCLVEYSLISLTVFFIMWRNIGKNNDHRNLRFGDRHIYTLNCSRASRGLIIGGIVIILTVLTLIPTFSIDDKAQIITQITELVLVILGMILVCSAFFHTTKIFLDSHAHTDAFDKVLIIITTFGNFCYSFFGLIASIFTDIEQTSDKSLLRIEVAIGVISIVQTFLQTAFILDTLKRRTRRQKDVRDKPGREAVTALLLVNLAIWLHDSISAKKVLLNPFQVNYYDPGTWAIIQAFTSPLSIFYRFHSSVCLADIWQEVYKDHRTSVKL